jgi:hypothetical protein
MKAVLEFDLPENNWEFQAAINGSKYKSAIWDYDQWLRAEMKYGELDKKIYEAYDTCRKKLRNILEEDNLFIEQ